MNRLYHVPLSPFCRKVRLTLAERSKYARSYIASMNVGDIVNVPFGKYEALECQSSVTSASHRMWGKSSVTTTINRPNQVVEIMRIL